MRKKELQIPHHVASVVAELHDTDTRFDIPEHAGHVTGAGDDLAVAEETAAAEVARMSAQLASPFAAGTAISIIEGVYGANVVQTTTGNEVARG